MKKFVTTNQGHERFKQPSTSNGEASSTGTGPSGAEPKNDPKVEMSKDKSPSKGKPPSGEKPKPTDDPKPSTSKGKSSSKEKKSKIKLKAVGESLVDAGVYLKDLVKAHDFNYAALFTEQGVKLAGGMFSKPGNWPLDARAEDIRASVERINSKEQECGSKKDRKRVVSLKFGGVNFILGAREHKMHELLCHGNGLDFVWIARVCGFVLVVVGRKDEEKFRAISTKVQLDIHGKQLLHRVPDTYVSPEP